MSDKTYRIFIVDDESESVDMLTDMISDRGHSLEPFTDPYQALQHFINCPANIVITDLCMPNIDGFEMIRRMRERSMTTEFIVITGNKNIQSVFQSRILGVTFLLFKPIKMKMLLSAIDGVIDRDRYWESKLEEIRN
ncbi:MAG: response regulator [Desulfobacterales bacterium]|nr:response regulator [Desulfobacterales bacterium]